MDVSAQQALKFHDVALVHLDTALPVKDVGSGSVPFLGSLEPSCLCHLARLKKWAAQAVCLL